MNFLLLRRSFRKVVVESDRLARKAGKSGSASLSGRKSNLRFSGYHDGLSPKLTTSGVVKVQCKLGLILNFCCLSVSSLVCYELNRFEWF